MKADNPLREEYLNRVVSQITHFRVFWPLFALNRKRLEQSPRGVGGVNLDFTQKRLAFFLAAALALAVAALYLPAAGYDFINLDDKVYTTKSELVRGGLASGGIEKALTRAHDNYWIPVTWLSLMADVELYGLGPGGFHRTNIILHVTNSLLFFAFLFWSTRAPLSSFLAAALWALHPMRVESVAWVSERKDLLAGFFFLLALLSYRRWALGEKRLWYLAALLAAFLGLASKPVMVVLPLVLLCVDLWPLERLGGEGAKTFKGLVVEKTPFFLLSAVFSAVTLSTQRSSLITAEVSLPSRLADGSFSTVHYLYETFSPAGLTLVDRESGVRPGGLEALLAALLVTALIAAALKARKSAPAVTAGLFWYLSALLPVSGIVPVGLFFLADHFTYLPAMGLSIAFVWGILAAAGDRVTLRRAVFWLLALCVLLLSLLTGAYLPKWKDSAALFGYLYSESPNDFNTRQLYNALSDSGRFEEADELLETMVARNPDDPLLNHRKGIALLKSDRPEEAVKAFERALELKPDYRDAHYSLGVAAAKAGKYETALSHAKRALDIDPEHWESLFLLGKIACETGRGAEAPAYFRLAAGKNPGDAEMMGAAGKILGGCGLAEEAVFFFGKAVELMPEDFGANLNLGIALYDSGRFAKASIYFEKSLRIERYPEAMLYSGLSLERAGRKEEAAAMFRELLRINPADETAREALSRMGFQ
jgi:tetratricopeptide (TPR) repeat protein